MCKWRATRRWKDLNKGYNFDLNLIPIGGLHKKLQCRKVAGLSALAISGLPFGNPRTKGHLDATLAGRCRVYYMGEGGGFLRIRAVVSLVSSKSPVALLSTKGAPVLTNSLLVLCRFMQVSELLVTLPNLILELQHAPLPF